MKEYNANFSYYSEEYGSFEELRINVTADSQFDARRLAWDSLDKRDDIKFMSCIKLCGITWEALPLNMQDYFNAQAAYDKYKIQYIENVDKPNAKIEQNVEKLEYCERERYSHFGSLHTVTAIAKDLGKPYGMPPPAIYEELHYAKEFCFLYGWEDNDKSSALFDMTERAEKWDSGTVFSIQELFRSGYGTAGGHELDFSAQFNKDGIYPVYYDRSDYESQYIYRWTNAREYKSLDSLPFFGEKDIITGSRSLLYEWQTLVINQESLPPEKQKPENSLWVAQTKTDENGSQDNERITVENPVTGDIAEFERSDFIGILRPEKFAKIDFDALKNEYKARNVEKEHPAGDIKPSILKTVEDNKNKIAQTDQPGKPKKAETNLE